MEDAKKKSWKKYGPVSPARLIAYYPQFKEALERLQAAVQMLETSPADAIWLPWTDTMPTEILDVIDFLSETERETRAAIICKQTGDKNPRELRREISDRELSNRKKRTKAAGIQPKKRGRPPKKGA